MDDPKINKGFYSILDYTTTIQTNSHGFQKLYEINTDQPIKIKLALTFIQLKGKWFKKC